jgi:hypothetical protein
MGGLRLSDACAAFVNNDDGVFAAVVAAPELSREGRADAPKSDHPELHEEPFLELGRIAIR